jgi:hypothetical protein
MTQRLPTTLRFCVNEGSEGGSKRDHPDHSSQLKTKSGIQTSEEPPTGLMVLRSAPLDISLDCTTLLIVS